jgi:hypothetical protein
MDYSPRESQTQEIPAFLALLRSWIRKDPEGVRLNSCEFSYDKNADFHCNSGGSEESQDGRLILDLFRHAEDLFGGRNSL